MVEKIGKIGTEPKKGQEETGRDRGQEIDQGGGQETGPEIDPGIADTETETDLGIGPETGPGITGGIDPEKGAGEIALQLGN